MGNSDYELSKNLYTPYVQDNVDLKNVRSIAWLGWQSANIFIENVITKCPNLEKSDLYDIQTDLGAQYWEINEDWDISDYDLVICFRTTVFVKDKNHFLRNLKKTIENNGKVIVDFLLPPIQYLSQFPVAVRNALRYINISYEQDCFISWCQLTPEPTDVESTHVRTEKCYASLHNRSGLYTTTQIRITTYRNISGYTLLPCFDVSIYPGNYKARTGVSFPEKCSFVTEEEKHMLLEEDFYKHGIHHMVKSFGFDYFLNYLPVWHVRPDAGIFYDGTVGEKTCTTLFTFQK